MSQYDISKFQSDLQEMDITLTEKQISQFLVYYEMLTEWNQSVNLTAITEYQDVMKKHFIDSLSLVKVYDVKSRSSVIDVGTGAGFPGLALKIAFPEMELTLLDSLNKRIHFLNAVIERLKLFGIKTLHGRAEDYARQDTYREQFDLCVSRAVANLSTLSEYCLPFVKKDGLFISYKSEKIGEQWKAAEKAISLLGGRVKEQLEFMLPGSDIFRNLFVIEKISDTPKRFPRKAGMPSKEPL